MSHSGPRALSAVRRLGDAADRLPDRLRRAVQRLRVRRGHYYSPHPDIARLRARSATLFADREEFAGVDLRVAEQLELIDELAPFARALPFAADPGEAGDLLYHYDNRPYPWGDGVVYAAMLQWARPRRILEVGAGYSTVLALDVRDRLGGEPFDLVSVDPHPERLRGLLGGTVPADFTLVAEPIQDVGPALAAELGDGDVLFVDSTHVVKAASDVNHIVLELLPRLAPGVLVHFHDVFGNFQYPREWLLGGRAWNEAYLVRAFLAFNTDFEVVVFAPWLARHRPEAIASLGSAAAVNPGGSLWIRRKRAHDRN